MWHLWFLMTGDIPFHTTHEITIDAFELWCWRRLLRFPVSQEVSPDQVPNHIGTLISDLQCPELWKMDVLQAPSQWSCYLTYGWIKQPLSTKLSGLHPISFLLLDSHLNNTNVPRVLFFLSNRFWIFNTFLAILTSNIAKTKQKLEQNSPFTPVLHSYSSYSFMLSRNIGTYC